MALVDYSIIGLLIVASFVGLAAVLFYTQFWRSSRSSPVEASEKPNNRRGSLIEFRGVPDRRTGLAPIPYRGWVLQYKRKFNGLYEITVENEETNEVNVLLGVNLGDNILSATGGTAKELVGKNKVYCNVDWANGIFPWDTMTVQMYKRVEDRIRNDRMMAMTKQAVSESLEFANVRGNLQDQLSADRIAQSLAGKRPIGRPPSNM